MFELSPADRKTQFVARLTDAGLVDDDGTALTLSQTGRLVYDRVTLAFYPPEAKSWLHGRRLSSAPSR